MYSYCCTIKIIIRLTYHNHLLYLEANSLAYFVIHVEILLGNWSRPSWRHCPCTHWLSAGGLLVESLKISVILLWPLHSALSFQYQMTFIFTVWFNTRLSNIVWGFCVDMGPMPHVCVTGQSTIARKVAKAARTVFGLFVGMFLRLWSDAFKRKIIKSKLG